MINFNLIQLNCYLDKPKINHYETYLLGFIEPRDVH